MPVDAQQNSCTTSQHEASNSVEVVDTLSKNSKRALKKQQRFNKRKQKQKEQPTTPISTSLEINSTSDHNLTVPTFNFY
eukprot:Awhi_evm1s14758